MNQERPVGKPYSQVYVERGSASEDNTRFRKRIGNYIDNQPLAHTGAIAGILRQEVGVKVYARTLASYFEKCSLTDLLDGITHVTTALRGAERYLKEDPVQNWLRFVSRALKEENVAYQVDRLGGVHPAFDEEFVAKRQATIAGLGGTRYAAVLDFYQKSIADLKPPYDTRDAVRMSFEAIENLTKLMLPIRRLTPNEVERHLKPLALTALSGTERNAVSLMLNALSDWVTACQQYRHASGNEEPDPPSLDLALWIVSDGAAHLRWLVALDRRQQAS